MENIKQKEVMGAEEFLQPDIDKRFGAGTQIRNDHYTARQWIELMHEFSSQKNSRLIEENERKDKSCEFWKNAFESEKNERLINLKTQFEQQAEIERLRDIIKKDLAINFNARVEESLNKTK